MRNFTSRKWDLNAFFLTTRTLFIFNFEVLSTLPDVVWNHAEQKTEYYASFPFRSDLTIFLNSFLFSSALGVSTPPVVWGRRLAACKLLARISFLPFLSFATSDVILSSFSFSTQCRFSFSSSESSDEDKPLSSVEAPQSCNGFLYSLSEKWF